LPGEVDKVEIVYRPKTHAEGERRVKRGEALKGTPWINPPVALHKVVFEYEGHLVRARDLGTVFNDACLMDAISSWGEDGPLYKDTLDGVMALAYDEALKLYEGVEIPPQIRNPNTPNGHPPPRTANGADGGHKPSPEVN
jgi:hypothetical protein